MLEKNCFIKYDIHIKNISFVQFIYIHVHMDVYEDIYLNYKASNNRCSFKI